MNNKCKFLRIRTKNYTKYHFCTHFKTQIQTNECRQCTFINYKQTTIKTHKNTLKTNVHKKHKTEIVSSSTFDFVSNRDNHRCILNSITNCLPNQPIQLHHINGRGKNKTNNVDNCVMVCINCHNLIHSKNKYWRKELNKYILEHKKKDTN